MKSDEVEKVIQKEKILENQAEQQKFALNARKINSNLVQRAEIEAYEDKIYRDNVEKEYLNLLAEDEGTVKDFLELEENKKELVLYKRYITNLQTNKFANQKTKAFDEQQQISMFMVHKRIAFEKYRASIIKDKYD